MEIKYYFSIFFIIIGICIFIWGLLNFLSIVNNSIWIKTTANITNHKYINNNSQILIHYKYIVNQSEYLGSALYNLNNQEESQTYDLEDKTINIYYYYYNPSISYKNKPNNGIYYIGIGIIIVVLSFLLLKKNNEDLIELEKTKEIFITNSNVPFADSNIN